MQEEEDNAMDQQNQDVKTDTIKPRSRGGVTLAGPHKATWYVTWEAQMCKTCETLGLVMGENEEKQLGYGPLYILWISSYCGLSLSSGLFMVFWEWSALAEDGLTVSI